MARTIVKPAGATTGTTTAKKLPLVPVGYSNKPVLPNGAGVVGATSTFMDRAKDVVSKSGENVYNAITGEGQFEGESSVRRGLEATSEAFNTPVKIAFQALPENVRADLEAVGGKIGGGFKSVIDKIGESPTLQKFVTEHPEATKIIEEVAGSLSAAGQISGNILAADQAAKLAQAGVNAATTGTEKVVQKVSAYIDSKKPLPPSEISKMRDGFKPGGDTFNTLKNYDSGISAGNPADIYKDVANKVFRPDKASKVVDDTVQYFKYQGHPELGEKFKKLVDIDNLTPDEVIAAGNKVLDDANPAFQKVLETVDPTLYKKGKIASLKNAGKEGGAVKGKLGTLESGYTKETRDIAHSLIKEDGTPLVSPKANPVENIANINDEIANISETKIRPALRANPNPYDIKALDDHLKNVQPADFIKADPVLEKTYTLAREKMIEAAKKNPLTNEGLWDSRISYDAIARKQIGSLAPTSEKVSAIKQAVLDMRQATNQFIVQNTPNGESVFGAPLKQLSNMYKAADNIAVNNWKVLDKGVIAKWIAENPMKAKAIEVTGIFGAGYGLLKQF